MSTGSRVKTAQRLLPALQKERRRNKRIELSLPGRFLDGTNNEHSLKIHNVSASGAMVQSDHSVPIGTELVCYIDELGRIAVTVTRHTANGFAVSFIAAGHKRDKLADRLTWLLNKDALGLQEERSAVRNPASGSAIVTRRDGRQIQCSARDISLTGASFTTKGPVPLVGEHVSTGNIRGEVVRSERGGFAIRYLQKGE